MSLGHNQLSCLFFPHNQIHIIFQFYFCSFPVQEAGETARKFGVVPVIFHIKNEKKERLFLWQLAKKHLGNYCRK